MMLSLLSVLRVKVEVQSAPTAMKYYILLDSAGQGRTSIIDTQIFGGGLEYSTVI